MEFSIVSKSLHGRIESFPCLPDCATDVQVDNCQGDSCQGRQLPRQDKYPSGYLSEWQLPRGCRMGNICALRQGQGFKKHGTVVPVELIRKVVKTRISSSVSNSIIFYRFCELSLSAKFLVWSMHPSGGRLFLVWWVTMLRMVGDNSWQLSPGLILVS